MSNDETQIIKLPKQQPKDEKSTIQTTRSDWSWSFVVLVGILCATVVAVVWICAGKF